MNLLITFLALTLPAEAGRRDAKSKRLVRLEQIEKHMLDEPDWKAGPSDEERLELQTQLSDCAEGIQAGCAEVGIAYAEGVTIAQNFDRSVALLKKSCESGALKGCTHLGLRYTEGQGVNQNFHRAAKLFSTSCKGGELEGCLNLGVSYTLGQAVEQDTFRGLNLFGHACKEGLTEACTMLKDYESALLKTKLAQSKKGGKGGGKAGGKGGVKPGGPGGEGGPGSEGGPGGGSLGGGCGVGVPSGAPTLPIGGGSLLMGRGCAPGGGG